jgi:hypothetical protein
MLRQDLRAAFAQMERSWAIWRTERPCKEALDAYLEDLATCERLHHELTKFSNYEPISEIIKASPPAIAQGIDNSHGGNRHATMDDEGMVERTSLGTNGAVLCPRRSPLLGAAIPHRVAIRQPVHCRGPVGKPADPFIVALATLAAMGGIAIIIHAIS